MRAVRLVHTDSCTLSRFFSNMWFAIFLAFSFRLLLSTFSPFFSFCPSFSFFLFFPLFCSFSSLPSFPSFSSFSSFSSFASSFSSFSSFSSVSCVSCVSYLRCFFFCLTFLLPALSSLVFSVTFAMTFASFRPGLVSLLLLPSSFFPTPLWGIILTLQFPLIPLTLLETSSAAILLTCHGASLQPRKSKVCSKQSLTRPLARGKKRSITWKERFWRISDEWNIIKSYIKSWTLWFFCFMSADASAAALSGSGCASTFARATLKSPSCSLTLNWRPSFRKISASPCPSGKSSPESTNVNSTASGYLLHPNPSWAPQG